MTDQIPTPDAVPSFQGQETPTATPKQEFLTKADFEAAFGALSTELTNKMSEWYRGVQSKSDKMEAAISKRISEYEERAKSQGYTLNEAQKKALEQTAIADVLNQPQQPSFPNASGPTQQGGDDLAERTNRAAEALMKATGVELFEDDPEVNIVESSANKSPEEYLAAVQQAIVAKKARLEKQAPPTRSPGAVGSGTPNLNPISDIMNPDELWKAAMEKASRR